MYSLFLINAACTWKYNPQYFNINYILLFGLMYVVIYEMYFVAEPL